MARAVTRFSRYILAGTLLAVLVWCSSPGTVWADGVADRLARASGFVDRAIATTGGGRVALVASALRELEVEPTFDQAEWLAEPLRENPPDLDLARARIDRETEALADVPGGFRPDSDPRASLTQVLSDSRFHPRTWQDNVPAILLPLALVATLVVDVIWGLIRWPFDRLWDLFAAFWNSWAFGPIVSVGAIFVIVLVFTLYRRGLKAILVRQAEVAVAHGDLPLTAADALAAAGREQALARYREACHFVLFATLLWIEEKGIARFDRSSTNREHLGQLARVAALPDRRLIGALEPVINRFDRVWYGQPYATVEDYHDLLALAGRVRDALT